MSKPRVEIDLTAASNLAAQIAAWNSGGVFAPGVALESMCECDVALLGYGETLSLSGRVIMVTATGVGIEFVGYDVTTKTALRNFGQLMQAAAQAATLAATSVATKAAATTEAATNASTSHASTADIDSTTDNASARVGRDATRAGPKPAHERLRNLPMAEQIKCALKGELAERILLEHIYGKTVWEPLLRNPRITPPEVARISRMGTLPRPLLETICNNGTWLQVPEIRRALLSNPRLSVDMIPRVLRLMPKHELKLVPTQTVYSMAVRDQARRLLKDAQS